MKLTEAQFGILIELATQPEFSPDHFKGRGNHLKIVVQRGFAEWMRAKQPLGNATGIRITDLGRAAIGAQEKGERSNG